MLTDERIFNMVLLNPALMLKGVKTMTAKVIYDVTYNVVAVGPI